MPTQTLRQRRLLLVLNLLAFQAAWFACVLGAARQMAALGVAAVAVAVGLQFLVSPARARDAALLAVSVAVGFVWDTVLARSGIVEYASPGPFEGWAPGWILALWALFSTTLGEPLRWLHGRRTLAALVGGLGGALSYWGAVRLGAGHFPDFALAMAVLAVGWGLITPGLIELARWLDARDTAQRRHER